MKICVIGKKNHLFWDESVVEAFKKLGYEVLHFQVNNRSISVNLFRTISTPLGRKNATKLSNKLHAEFLYKKCLDFKPDFVFVVSAFFVPLVFYKVLKELPNNPQIAAWDGDTAIRYPQSKEYSPYIDILFSCSKYYVDNKILDFPNVHHLLMAVNEHRFYRGSNHLKIAYFCAAHTDEREEFIKKLPLDKLIVKGWGWDEFRHKNILNKKISINEVASDYRKYFLTLNKHQKENAPHQELNMRTFEAPASGSLILSDFREEMDLAYEPNKEVLMYKNIEEAIMYLEKMFADYKFAQKIAKNAYKRTVSEHTYEKRMLTALDIIKNY